MNLRPFTGHIWKYMQQGGTHIASASSFVHKVLVYCEFALICWLLQRVSGAESGHQKDPARSLSYCTRSVISSSPHEFISLNYCIWTFKQPIKGYVWVHITRYTHITSFGPYICQRAQRSPMQTHDVNIQRDRDIDIQKLVLRENER